MGREAADWYVMIAGERVGPLTRVELGLHVESGTIDSLSHVWKAGMTGWQHGVDVPELRVLFDPGVLMSPPQTPVMKPPPVALKPVSSVRSAGAPAKAPEIGKGEIGKGLMELDTGHFRLAELKALAESGKKGEGAAEFDTGHFALKDLAELKAAMQKGGKGEGASEFDTGHFRLSDLGASTSAQEPLALETDEAIYQPGVNSARIEAPVRRPASIAKPAPAAPLPRPPSSPGFPRAPRPASSPGISRPPRPASSPGITPSLRPASSPGFVRPPRPASSPGLPASPRPPSTPGRGSAQRLEPIAPASEAVVAPARRASSSAVVPLLVAGLGALGIVAAYLLLR